MWIKTPWFYVQVGRLNDRSGCPYGINFYWDPAPASGGKASYIRLAFRHERAFMLPYWMVPAHTHLLNLPEAKGPPHVPCALDFMSEDQLAEVLIKHNASSAE